MGAWREEWQQEGEERKDDIERGEGGKVGAGRAWRKGKDDDERREATGV